MLDKSVEDASRSGRRPLAAESIPDSAGNGNRDPGAAAAGDLAGLPARRLWSRDNVRRVCTGDLDVSASE